MNTGMAVISFTTEICKDGECQSRCQNQTRRLSIKTHHLETVIGKLSSRVCAGTVYSRVFACVLSCLQDPSNCSLQLGIEFASDGMSNVVPKIPGSNKQHVDAIDLGNLLNLYRRKSAPCQLNHVECTYHIQRLFGFNLHDCQEIVVCVVHIV
jgi:hypothetical protein